ncbi:MAG: hypothetical protein KME60_12560 [Cyanomargarita calcarea GSE-NOS-MK-12-04C]|jgi:hypothetical protein|uniref:Uncharacterized protein n=1 Tax=Cyanomargarita calcarea GSE-NOS-MK-12-04C TaxID=2839659 RepID=A0A951QLI1_9CYAN|nr:hypothetical protein [Cyanomargarita calcarea GSE-NOS-MK-12-04C]
MADDKIPEYIDKRLRYFYNQFLQEQDFTEEQNYHIDRQRRHNRLLHTPGVPDGGGLDVIKTGDTQVRVDPGTAIDGQGRQILLSKSRSVDIKDNEGKLFQQGQLVYLVISYSVQPSDKTTVGGEGETRWLESPEIKCYDQDRVPTDEDIKLRLAQLKIGEGGRIDEVNTKVRKTAGGKTAFSTNSIDETLLKETVRAKLVTKGDGHEHSSGDGAKIKHSNLDLGNDRNPHKTTAADVNALSLNGGTVKGNVTIDNPGRLDVFGRTFLKIKMPGVFDGNNNISDKGSLFVVNTEQKSYALVAKVSTTENEVPQKKPIPPAAIVAIASFDGVHGIYATSNTGTPALNVDGTALINGKLSGTHIVDTFTNASGQRLTAGDVVKLKGTPVTRFRGQQNKAPIAEVTLTDRENDTLAIGIVDGKAFRDNALPDTKLESESAFIEDGEDLYLVTLGVFAHCKVDATEAPIEVGDLLTTSKNPGHAKKATEPKLGSIIGKALQPLEKGTGEISVFVNIQ